MVSGHSTIKSDQIKGNDKIAFESQVYFQKPVRGRKWSKLQSYWQSNILRFKSVNGTQLGVIHDNRITFMVSNLMDTGVCEFEGQVLLIGNNDSNEIELNDEIFLDMKIYLLVRLKLIFYYL